MDLNLSQNELQKKKTKSRECVSNLTFPLVVRSPKCDEHFPHRWRRTKGLHKIAIMKLETKTIITESVSDYPRD